MTPGIRSMITGNGGRQALGASVSAAYARGLLELAVAKGARRAALLERSGIGPRDLADPDARIPFANYTALMRAARHDSGDAALAIHYGEETDLAQFSILGLIGQASETMWDAFAQLNRYVRLVVDVDLSGTARFELRREGEALWLVDTRANPDEFPELTESAFAQIVSAPRHLGIPPFARAVRVTHARPDHAAEYERVFGAPVTFESDRNGILIDGAVMEHRVGLLPRYAFGVLTGHADALLEALNSAKSTRGRVERRLVSILHTGRASMAGIAADIGMSRQTLYRRLKAEGVTYEQVLDELRQRLALQYLSGQAVSVNETAYLVGYSDPAAFSRAFKRWTGRSPRHARSAP
jgi:AraC-like DNA-binding protein